MTTGFPVGSALLRNAILEEPVGMQRHSKIDEVLAEPHQPTGSSSVEDPAKSSSSKTTEAKLEAAAARDAAAERIVPKPVNS